MPMSPEITHHRDGDGEVEVFSEDDCESPEDPNAPLRFNFKWKKLLRFMGPGWLMSLAYLDPGNLESDLQQGAYTGMSLVWVLFWATIVGLILQEMSARIGVVTGRDLAQNVKAGYPKWLCWVIYVNMEIAVIGSDIQEVVGSGIALNLLSSGAIPVWVGCIITGVDTFTFLAVHYLGVRYLEALIVVLIGTMSICFFVNWGETPTDVGALVHGWLVPTVPAYGVTQAVGIVGAVIMPHNLYLHSGLVLSRNVDRNSPRRVYEAINYNFIESALALLFSFFLNLAIVSTNANSFFVPECANIAGGPLACMNLAAIDGTGSGTCQLPGGGQGVCAEIGLVTEGDALSYGLGSYSLYIWALGLLAAGQASTMTCTYAGQIIMGGCLEIELAPWKRVAFTRTIALGPSLLVAAYSIESNLFNNINEYLNVLQAVQLPFAMLPVLHFVMQDSMGRFRPGGLGTIVNVCLAILVLGINVASAVEFTESYSGTSLVFVCLYAVCYAIVVIRLVSDDLLSVLNRVRGASHAQEPHEALVENN
eukprot:TRINITY_DN62619_c0_g1_i1.p1 TRINITY_DN62619_c0_g1~~TRINITY_DN62619_c0_g1_i1.p1  ORF type:complete len:535 (-),score=71.77 TRINITY_DN62619_c0_g1_i1:24-1628(-)